jgi:hypothetical protein
VVPTQPRSARRRRVGFLATAAALVVLAASSAAWLIAEPASSRAPTAAIQNAGLDLGQSAPPIASPTAAASTTAPALPSHSTSSSPSLVKTIEIEGSGATAEPFETVRVHGTYHGGGQRFLQVQWRVNGRWQAFPVPAKTDGSGQFTAYVELARPHDYRLRVRDPQSGHTSDPFTLTITDPAGA